MAVRPLIAVVDDDPVYSEMISTMLDAEGYATVLIDDATTAVERLRQTDPALVLLDVRMGSAQAGVDILDALRADQATVDLPVIVCTADRAFLRSHTEYLASRNAGTMPKPFDIDDMLDTVRREIEGRH